MPTKGDLFFALKEKKVFPKNEDYSNHIKSWFMSNDSKIFPKCSKTNVCQKLLVAKNRIP